MSDNIYNDPQGLRTFAADLDRFANLVENTRESVLRDLSNLGDTWQDSQYSQFCESFSRIYRLLDHFIPVLRAVSPELRSDAETLENFQRSAQSL